MDHASINRDYWNGMAHDWVEMGERAWASPPSWGIWTASEDELKLLPEDMTGMHAVELGCGTGYVSAWMDARGAQVTGLDISAKQLATARRLAKEHKRDITFIEGDAENTGLQDSSFDFAISEYGAAIWCDPKIWLAEAWRILKPGGRLVFLGSHPLTMVATPLNGDVPDRTLHRSYRTLSVLDWQNVEIDPGGVEFNLSHGNWYQLFAKIGFEVAMYHEIYAPAAASGQKFAVTAEWSKEYPSEQIWVLNKPTS